MIVIGIDPGSQVTGYGILQQQGRKVSYLASGILKLKDAEDFYARLPQAAQFFQNLIERYRPQVVAFESLIFVKGTTSMLKLAQTRGAILSSITESIRVCEYSPNSVKSSVAGHGHADKESVQKSLKFFLGSATPKFQTHDESDAVAIALCHLLNDTKGSSRKASAKGLAAAVAHKF